MRISLCSDGALYYLMGTPNFILATDCVTMHENVMQIYEYYIVKVFRVSKYPIKLMTLVMSVLTVLQLVPSVLF